jgi:hypothetical protein
VTLETCVVGGIFLATVDRRKHGVGLRYLLRLEKDILKSGRKQFACVFIVLHLQLNLFDL